MHYWQESKLVQPLWKTVWRLLKKLKIELLYELAISLLGIYPKQLKAGPRRDICIFMLIAVLFSQDVKATSMSMKNEWISKMWYAHTIECYSALKRNSCHMLQMDEP